ncbi:NUDIX hydrolase [soil metagenome]
MRSGEDLLAAAERELAEETGLTAHVHLEQRATYAASDRDPRGRVVSVAHLALVPQRVAGGIPRGGGDAASAAWRPVDDLLAGPLAFDHHTILAEGVARARAKLEYTPLGAALCEPEFTIAELRAVYEAVWGTALDPRNFHRKVTGAVGFVEATGEHTTRQGGRPAQLFRNGSARLLHPPMLSPDSVATLDG